MKTHVYVINLAQEIDRKNSIEKQFKKLDFYNYSFVEGVYGPSLTEEVKTKLYNNKLAEKINTSLIDRQIGASLSHQKCYSSIVTNNIAHAVIIEDDVVFDHRFIDFIESFDSKDHKNCDFLMLGYFTSNVRKHNSKPLTYPYEIVQYTNNNIGYETVAYLKKENRISVKDYVFYEFDSQSYKVDFLQGAHAYLISNKAARNLMHLNSRVVVECDNIWNFFYRDINFSLYGSVPPLVLCNNTVKSEVENEKLDFKNQIKVSERFLERINKHTFGT